jgi:hypothetical protein
VVGRWCGGDAGESFDLLLKAGADGVVSSLGEGGARIADLVRRR